MAEHLAPSGRPWRVALIGCGRISVYHIAALKEIVGVDLVGVCDLDAGAARACATEHGIRGCYTDAESMLRELKPDAVHILTPPASHVALAQLAAEHGAHMYIEKPFAANRADAELILQAARQAGVQVCPGHSRLFDPVFLEACRRIRTGQIGRVVSVRAEQGFTYEAAARGSVIPWSYGYDWGIFDNLFCHPLYLACHFLRNPGSPRVAGFNVGSIREAGVEEIRALIPSDTGVGEVSLSLSSAPEVNRLEVVGTRGRVLADWQTMTVLTLRKTRWPSALARFTQNFSTALDLARAGLQTLTGVATGKVKRYQGLRKIVEEFHLALREGTSIPVSAEEGLLNVSLMDQIKQSCEAQRKQRPAPQVRVAGQRPRILVTGATGFLGGRLIEMLSSQGIALRATTRLISRARELPSVEWVQCDLGDETQLRQALCDIDTIFHCAALCGAPGSLKDFEDVNVAGTRRLLDLASERGVRQFIYVSSMSVYAVPADPAATLDESAPLDRRAAERGSYTQSKLAAETAVLEHARQQQFPRILVLRPGTIYGPGAKLPTGRFQLPSSSDRPLIAGSRQIPAGLVYVDDVVDAMLAAARSDVASGSIYNLVESSECDQGELARTLHQISGGRIRPLFVPYPLVWTAMFGVDLLSLVRKRKLGTARYRLQRTLAPLRFDCAAARRDLSWRPRVPLVVGLSKTLNHQIESAAEV
jgi:2-alkyl-3-oxoalkanoate reductase